MMRLLRSSASFTAALCWAALTVAVLSSSSGIFVQAERFLDTGEACEFPIEFKGELAYDCVSWNDEEWCRSAAGLWGHCKASEGASTQRVQTAASGGNAGTAASPKPTVVINEVLANAPKGGEDFIELMNTGDSDVELTGWKIFDKSGGNSNKDAEDGTDDDKEDDGEENIFEFGGPKCKNTSSIAAGSKLLLVKDNECSFTFGLGRKDSVTLQSKDGSLIDHISWTKQNALDGISYGRLPDGEGQFQRSQTTPGEENKAALVTKLKEELPEGADVSGECCKKLKNIGFKSNLPVIVIDTKCQDVVDEPKIRTQMCTCSNSDGHSGGDSDVIDYDGWAGIEIRGSSSARDHKKKGMAVQLWNSTSHDMDFPLLGFPKDEDFVLYGPETDRSIGLRNFLAYNISRAMGNYASRTQFTEVFMKDDCRPLSMLDYHGVFLLEEKIKRGKKRVDICKHAVGATPSEEDGDITGGYVFKHDNDNIDNGDVVFPIKKGFDSKRKLPMVLIYPKGEKSELDRELTYLEDTLNGFEAALKGNSFTDPDQGYQKFIDVDGFVDYFLGTEITKNPDAYRGSTYMHKDCGKKFTMGPMWDYNEAFGMCCGYPIEGFMDSGKSDGISGGSAISTNGWRFNICQDVGRCKRDPVDGVSHWFIRLWQDPAFKQRAASRWRELRDGPLSNENIEGTIDSVVDEVRPAAVRNYNKWYDVIGSSHYRTTQDQWEHEVEQLRTWLIEHMEWMDGELGKYYTGNFTRGN
mmetsp:Transcript_4385/g.11363  ORF Transcript_4385/g.11363 Transcript_4385/m.11363 type:complete len:750 (-) Transcript_4385:97-2346(-)